MRGEDEGTLQRLHLLAELFVKIEDLRIEELMVSGPEHGFEMRSRKGHANAARAIVEEEDVNVETSFGHCQSSHGRFPTIKVGPKGLPVERTHPLFRSL